MIRVMGNSSERVPIKDLGDSIYYRQTKEYSDTEYETSADLKRALSSGKVVKIEQVPSFRASSDISSQSVASAGVSLHDFKTALRELTPQGLSGEDLKKAVREMVPVLVDMIRQEISRAPVQQAGSVQVSKSPSEVQDLIYVPSITTENMVSNIKAQETEVSNNDAINALEALKKLQGIKND